MPSALVDDKFWLLIEPLSDPDRRAGGLGPGVGAGDPLPRLPRGDPPDRLDTSPQRHEPGQFESKSDPDTRPPGSSLFKSCPVRSIARCRKYNDLPA